MSSPPRGFAMSSPSFFISRSAAADRQRIQKWSSSAISYQTSENSAGLATDKNSICPILAFPNQCAEQLVETEFVSACCVDPIKQAAQTEVRPRPQKIWLKYLRCQAIGRPAVYRELDIAAHIGYDYT